MRIDNKLQDLKNEFDVSSEKIVEIAKLFKKAMEDGLGGFESPLKMLPSFIGSPSGNECGVFYTVDMGGTNVRSTKFELKNGSFENLGEVKSKLKDAEGKYDYTSGDTTGEELFDFFAELISKLISPNETGYLGHTFSFPSRQAGINEAFLIEWTKEIKVSGVVGNNPNYLLSEALKRRNIMVTPRAIINDTVGTLLVAAYMYKDAHVGTIMGTGHNTCYLEAKHPINGCEMIVNMETGNFNIGLPITKYDLTIDANSATPGAQILEKMISGYYIGDIVTLIIKDFYENAALFSDCSSSMELLSKNKIDSLTVENFILYPDRTIQSINCKKEDALILKEISEAVVRRASRLAAATYIGTLLHIDAGEIRNNHVIAVDGTIYEKMPRVPELLDEAFLEALKEKSKLISVKLVKDGSGLGAAIAAAVAVKLYPK